ncbi:DUF3592 domain-containing protein [Saccharopolyspora hordei]|uniref:DUF3592 domain-containing protein n=1 Tax=Saccharopolyspora hordei TaxID=1838 RepID=UPI001FECC65B|nr:DUF3592 domain-containing protein [Saccharopolyspora hordei]
MRRSDDGGRHRAEQGGDDGALQSVTVASDAVAPDAADLVTGSSTEGDRSVARPSRRKAWARAARGVLVVGVLMTAMGLSIIIACFINDRTIEEARGEAVAEVVDTSLTRTVVRFNTDEGRVYIPPNGVLYPEDLQTGQTVRVEYDSRNPDLVRVAGRGATLSFLPVGSLLAVVWAVLLPLYWLFRRAATR